MPSRTQIQASILFKLGFDNTSYKGGSGPIFFYNIAPLAEIRRLTCNVIVTMDQPKGIIEQFSGGTMVLITILLISPAAVFGFFSWRISITRPYRLQTMVTNKAFKLCNSTQTVTSELASDPNQTPSSVFKHLYGSHHQVTHHGDHDLKVTQEEVDEFDAADALTKARACGKWDSAEPSELFLQVKIHFEGIYYLGEPSLTPFNLGVPRCTFCRRKEPRSWCCVTSTDGSYRYRSSHDCRTFARSMSSSCELYRASQARDLLGNKFLDSL